ncbi:putative bacterial non-heme ferritin [Dyadobacter sp. CECT 9623]|jgi:ferritin|uniref:Ferritin n=1 Tax=Dyadobacter linearis TaxID=2823330 RepID=A0ABM8ULE3_9BACT|nr:MULTISPECIES: ferritin [unclassified Dyadobacter]MCE7060969.1 ferritin [Dyadobacter sp. CY343]CAG5068264.1 putative bacterial non-heme ferritin [Dyadobacter sp. CECT 9623]
MRDLLRQRTSLKEEIEILLNNQVKMEAEASAKYLAMASWCDRNGFRYSAKYFMKQSEEEREHMVKIFDYLMFVGGNATSPEVPAVRHEFPTFKSIFEAALQSEIAVTQSINRIVSQSRKEEDYATENFLQWFVKEQTEEEDNARRALELFDVIGEEGTGQYFIDKAIGKLGHEE